MKVKQQKLIEMANLFNRAKRGPGSVRFHYKVLQNMDKIQPIIKRLQDTNQNSPEYDEYDQKRTAVCLTLGEKDKQGKPMILVDVQGNRSYKIPKDKQEEFDEVVNELKEDYKEAIEEYEKRQKEFEEILQEEVDVELVRFKFSEIPEQFSGTDLEVVFFLIDEPQGD